jgi:acetyltransferase-like isoleucine patch superfamily enzyme
VNLSALGAILGKLPPTVEHPAEYFLQRGCFIDARSPLEISGSSVWGFGVRVLTRSHDIAAGSVGTVVPRPLTVEAGAWIGSFALLYNCTIGEGAVVAAGSVVRSCDVAPWVMVAGNPARVIARWDGQEWRHVELKLGRLE